MLNCPRCKTAFIHSKVKANAEPPFLLFQKIAKPEFPSSGVSLECPNCKAISIYQRYQLTDSVDSDAATNRNGMGF
jgi:phage FluMu protein Com